MSEFIKIYNHRVRIEDISTYEGDLALSCLHLHMRCGHSLHLMFHTNTSLLENILNRLDEYFRVNSDRE